MVLVHHHGWSILATHRRVWQELDTAAVEKSARSYHSLISLVLTHETTCCGGFSALNAVPNLADSTLTVNWTCCTLRYVLAMC
jgi:hypothetical protein